MIIFKFVFFNRSIYLVKLESMYMDIKIVDKYKIQNAIHVREIDIKIDILR